MKWVLVIVLAIIGVLAAIVAIEYFVVPIHSLPSFIPDVMPPLVTTASGGRLPP